MPGLFATLDLGARSLQTQQQGVQVAGHNLANVNNPAYARQRLQIQTSPPVRTAIGPQGTGAEGTAVVQLRSALLDQQIQIETSVTGYLEAQRNGLLSAEAGLGQTLDTMAGGTTGTGAAGTTGSQTGLAAGLSDLFNAFQSLSTDADSQTERGVLVGVAADLASRFNQTDQRLAAVQAQLDTSLQSDVAGANELLAQIASLNDQIAQSEVNAPGAANDLRDLRQHKLEQLGTLAKVDLGADANGALTISAAGTLLVSGSSVLDRLETYDAGGGQLLVRAQASGTALNLTGGSIAGTIDARDGAIASLRSNINLLASNLIAEVNNVHRAGFDLNGGTGADFFTGTNAADIRVNSALLADPRLVQAGATPGAAADNQVALALAQLAHQPVAALNDQTFSQNYSRTVSQLGQALSSVDTRLEDQSRVESLLLARRDSVSGVSLDEEMTDMMKYQKAFQASARLIAVVDEMLDSLLGMKR